MLEACWHFPPRLLLWSAMARLARRGKHHVTQEHGREGCWAPCQPITEQDRTPLTNQEPTLLPELISNVTDSNKLGPDELYFFTKWNKSKTTQIFKLIHLHWKYYPSPLFADQFILPRSHLVASDNVESWREWRGPSVTMSRSSRAASTPSTSTSVGSVRDHLTSGQHQPEDLFTFSMFR